MKITNIDKQLEWWNNLPTIEKIALLKEYPFEVTLDEVNNNTICFLYDLYHKETVTPSNVDKLSFAMQMKDVPLEERYDYAITIILSLPISIDDISDILQILIKSRNNLKGK